MSYCLFCQDRPEGDLHRIYHDQVYGFPAKDDQELFERFCLEINQAGLSWEIILKKKHAYMIAFDNFDIETVAGYTEEKVGELMLNSGIVRNKLKISAVIRNAKAILAIQLVTSILYLPKLHLRSTLTWQKNSSATTLMSLEPCWYLAVHSR